MNADIISMYVKLPLFKHFEQFLWHSCISIICQKIPGRSLSVMFNYYSSERIHACSYRLNSCQKQLIKQTWYFSGIICGIAVCSTPVILQHKVTQHIFWMFLFLLCYFKLHLPCCQLSRIIQETPYFGPYLLVSRLWNLPTTLCCLSYFNVNIKHLLINSGVPL